MDSTLNEQQHLEELARLVREVDEAEQSLQRAIALMKKAEQQRSAAVMNALGAPYDITPDFLALHTKVLKKDVEAIAWVHGVTPKQETKQKKR